MKFRKILAASIAFAAALCFSGCEHEEWLDVYEIEEELEKAWGTDFTIYSEDENNSGSENDRTREYVFKDPEGVKATVRGERSYGWGGSSVSYGCEDYYYNRLSLEIDGYMERVTNAGFSWVSGHDGVDIYVDITEFDEIKPAAELVFDIAAEGPFISCEKSEVICKNFSRFYVRYQSWCELAVSTDVKFDDNVRLEKIEAFKESFVDACRNGEISAELPDELYDKYFAKTLDVVLNGNDTGLSAQYREELGEYAVRLKMTYKYDAENKTYYEACPNLEKLVYALGGSITYHDFDMKNYEKEFCMFECEIGGSNYKIGEKNGKLRIIRDGSEMKINGSYGKYTDNYPGGSITLTVNDLIQLFGLDAEIDSTKDNKIYFEVTFNQPADSSDVIITSK